MLAAAITALTTAVQAISANNAARPSSGPVLDPHSPNVPYDLASRAGLNVLNQASEALDMTWDGTAEQFPPFLLALRIRARDVKWDVSSPTGILKFFEGNKHLLNDYSNITAQECAFAHTGRTDDRARQNAKSMYHTLKKSITGIIKTTIFDQLENIPDQDNGPTLFILMTQFTLSSAIQLSMLAFWQILNFDPHKYNYIIPTINTQLNHLFVMATTNNRIVSDAEKLQHIISTNDRIKQTESWAQWVGSTVERIEDGSLVHPQKILNNGALKYTKILASEGKFSESSNTVQQDIVAMLGSFGGKKKKNPPQQLDKSSGNDQPQPLFMKHFETKKWSEI